MGGAGVGQPTWKMGMFLLGPWLTEPFFKNFKTNGASRQTLKQNFHFLLQSRYTRDYNKSGISIE